MQPDQATFLLDYLLPSIENEVAITKKVIAAIPEDKRDYRPAGIDTVAGVLARYGDKLPPALEKVKAMPAEKLAADTPFFGILNEPLVACLSMFIVHSVHHRGQLSVYLRPMGAKVPDIYGGSADEPFQPPA